MSYWQFVPFDILTSLLPYFDFETLKEIEAFTADPYIHSRLCQDETYFWRYLFTHKLSVKLPTSDISLKERYIEYLAVKRNCKDAGITLGLMSLDNELETLLNFAANSGYEVLFQKLIEVHLKDMYIGQAFIMAAECSFVATMKYLHEHHKVHMSSHTHSISLVAAAEKGNFEIIKCLAEFGTNVHAFNDEALLHAVMGGYLNIVKYLLEYDEKTVRSNIEAALRSAYSSGHVDIQQYLKKYLT